MEMLNFLSFYKVHYARTVRPYIAKLKMTKASKSYTACVRKHTPDYEGHIVRVSVRKYVKYINVHE